MARGNFVLWILPYFIINIKTFSLNAGVNLFYSAEEHNNSAGTCKNCTEENCSSMFLW